MKRAIASSLFAAALFAGSTPVTRAQPAPEPAASALPDLQEIGRTRATTTACAFMRDVVVPRSPPRSAPTRGSAPLGRAYRPISS